MGWACSSDAPEAADTHDETRVNYVQWWLSAFCLTLSIELPLVVLLLRPTASSRWRRLGAGVFANLASHPAVWFIFTELGLPWLGMLAAAESWALLLELVFYRFVFPGISWKRALAASSIANAASFGLGLLIMRTLRAALGQ